MLFAYQWDEETQFFGIILYREICCEFVLLQCAALDNAMAAKRESKAKLEY